MYPLIATDIMDPRPTLDVENLWSPPELDEKRRKAISCHIHTSHAARRIYQAYRSLQYKKMQEHEGGSKKDAITDSEDPDPYEPSYVFYCL